MIVVASASFPHQSLKEAAKAFLTLTPLPASVKRQGPYFKIEEDADIKAITLYEFNSSFTPKAQEFLASRYKPFAEVPGFSSSIAQRLDMEEALAKLNIKH